MREQRSIALERGQKRKAVDVALLPGERNVVAEFAALHAVGQARKNLVAIETARPSGDALEDLAIGVNAVAIVSGKDFVAAVAGERDRHVLARHLRHVVGGQHGGVAEGLFERSW